MNWLSNLFLKAFGVEANSWIIFWNIIGWLGNGAFLMRFLVQWHATEKQKKVVVPALFWWLSLVGSLLLLVYAVFYNKHYVIIFSYALNWIPYIRNLIIHYRHKEAHLDCPNCAHSCPPQNKFCSECGTKLAVPEQKLTV
jgi:lipid-A-disaccharide synthase-like uncharacterized protein